MGKQKVNPRRKPASEADVKKEYKRGRNEAIEFALAVSCLSVYDVFNPSQDKMQAFLDKHTANVGAIVSGEIKYADVIGTLKEEYNLDVEWK